MTFPASRIHDLVLVGRTLGIIVTGASQKIIGADTTAMKLSSAVGGMMSLLGSGGGFNIPALGQVSGLMSQANGIANSIRGLSGMLPGGLSAFPQLGSIATNLSGLAGASGALGSFAGHLSGQMSNLPQTMTMISNLASMSSMMGSPMSGGAISSMTNSMLGSVLGGGSSALSGFGGPMSQIQQAVGSIGQLGQIGSIGAIGGQLGAITGALGSIQNLSGPLTGMMSSEMSAIAGGANRLLRLAQVLTMAGYSGSNLLGPILAATGSSQLLNLLQQAGGGQPVPGTAQAIPKFKVGDTVALRTYIVDRDTTFQAGSVGMVTRAPVQGDTTYSVEFAQPVQAVLRVDESVLVSSA